MPHDPTQIPVALLTEVLQAIRAARPSTQLPEASTIALTLPATDWTVDVYRAVHGDLTRTLRGLVEDAGYDPDMLPVPPQHIRVMSLDGDRVLLQVPDPDDALIAAIKTIPGQAWNATDRHWSIPAIGATLEPLRMLVRRHRLTPTPEAIDRLRAVAADVAANPDAAAVATIAVTPAGRVQVTLAAAHPALADALKRVPALKWDPAVSAYTAPGTRLRDTLAATSAFHTIHDPSVAAALANLDAPLVYDGTLDGLRGIPVTDLHAVDGKKAERFAEFNIHSVFDLLLLTPRKYLDRSNLTPIRALQAGQEVGILATVTAVTVDQRKRLVRIMVSDPTGKLSVTYFNAIWQAKRFRAGDEVAIWGKVEAWTGSSRTMLGLTNPIMDPVGDDTLAVIPVYPQSAKSRITTWEVHTAAAETLRRLGTLTDPLPADTLAELDLMGRADALRTIHLPTSLEAATAARTRLAFDELYRMQAALLARKATEEAETGIAHVGDGSLTSPFLARLPYALTGAQTRALAEVTANLAAVHPMHRLLQGDVGSGKTMLALLTLLTGVESGYQGALMAPTEILASQLYAELVERTAGLDTRDGRPLRVEFFSNKLRGKKRDAILADLAAGLIDIAVGTHALLVPDVAFQHLGVVVVDEQHRFGVEQRAALREKGALLEVNGTQVHVRPDMLVMTATPIPRTASMTVFGDLDVSVLDELPPGRTPIVTSWIDAAPDLFSHDAAPWPDVRAQVAAGRQAYVVTPLVEESEKLQATSAVETFEALSSGALAGLRVGLVHGQQNADGRAATMAGFRDGTIDVLVATTVIEVGVNVPNATVIAILDSGRFGIAQLHQLRGRVGRGRHASSCVLVGRCTSPDGRARMEALVASTDGFYLSEVDLALRGHGQVFGTAQSGQSDLRVADLDTDRDLLVLAREHASRLLAGDPRLARHPGLRSEIVAVLGVDGVDWLGKS